MTNSALHSHLIKRTLDMMNYHMNDCGMEMAEAYDVVKSKSCAGPTVWLAVTDIIINQ